MIPKKILRTSKSYDQKIENLLMLKFNGWGHHYFSDEGCIEYIKNNKIDGIDNAYEKYIQYQNGAHRADFFRYYFLYINGGGFIDADLIIYKNIDELFLNKKFVSIESLGHPGHIFQGFLFVEKESEIIYRALKKMYDADKAEVNFINGGSIEGYLKVCKDLYDILQDYIPSDEISIYKESNSIAYISPNTKNKYGATKIGKDGDWFGVHWQSEKSIYNWDIKEQKDYDFSLEKEKEIQQLLKVHKTYGEDYVRIGSARDGGYVMINDMSKDDVVISCGIGDNISWKTEDINFEYQVSELVGGIDMYECAIDSLSNMPTNGRFFKARIGDDTNMKDLLENAEPQEDYVLKIDIEGSEWDFFNNAESSDIEKFRQIIIELHWLNNLQKNNEMSKKIINALSKINKTHKLVLVHGNNNGTLFNYGNLVIPDVIEALYLRKDSYNFVDENEKYFDHPEKFNAACNDFYPELNHYLG